MSVPPDLVHSLRQWVLKAEEDFRAATLLAALVTSEGDDAPLVAVCFHAQQCVEKYIKALLTKSGIAVRKTHNLVALWRALPAAQSAALKDVSRGAMNYASLLLGHIGKEDDILYPMAMDTIPDARWKVLKTEFDRVEAERMGPKRRAGYLELVDRLVIAYPAPALVRPSGGMCH